jgi:hypothetical protein
MEEEKTPGAVLRTLGQHCSSTSGDLAFLEQARAAPDQVLVRPLLAAVTGVCAGGAPVRAPARSERMAAGEARRGRWDAAVRRACEGEQYRRRRRSSMSSRSAAECACMVLHELSVKHERVRAACRASKQIVGGISPVLMDDQSSQSPDFCLWALGVSDCVWCMWLPLFP